MQPAKTLEPWSQQTCMHGQHDTIRYSMAGADNTTINDTSTVTHAAQGGRWGYLHLPGFSCASLTNEINKQLNSHAFTLHITCSTRKLVKSSHHSYLWTSWPSLLFVIFQHNPLLGSKPGCEISKRCFLTNFMYLRLELEGHMKLP